MLDSGHGTRYPDVVLLDRDQVDRVARGRKRREQREAARKLDECAWKPLEELKSATTQNFDSRVRHLCDNSTTQALVTLHSRSD